MLPFGGSMLFFAASLARDLLNGISTFMAKLLNGVSKKRKDWPEAKTFFSFIQYLYNIRVT